MGRSEAWSAPERHEDLYVLNVNGSGAVRLTDDPADDGDPAWGSDLTPTGLFVARESAHQESLYPLPARNPTDTAPALIFASETSRLRT